MTSYFSSEYSWSLPQPSRPGFGFYWGCQPLQKSYKWSCLCLPDGVTVLGKRKNRVRGNLTSTHFSYSLNYWNHFISRWWGKGENNHLALFPYLSQTCSEVLAEGKEKIFHGRKINNYKERRKGKKMEEEDTAGKWRLMLKWLPLKNSCFRVVTGPIVSTQSGRCYLCYLWGSLIILI